MRSVFIRPLSVFLSLEPKHHQNSVVRGYCSVVASTLFLLDKTLLRRPIASNCNIITLIDSKSLLTVWKQNKNKPTYNMHHKSKTCDASAVFSLKYILQ